MKIILSALFILLTTGCVNTGSLYRNYQQQVQESVPQQWLADFMEGSVSNNWLHQLGDAQLIKLVQEGINQNHSLKSAAASVATSYAQVNVATGGNVPKLNLDLRANRTRSNSEASNTGEISYASLLDLSLSLSWNIDLWGKLRSHEKAAMHRYHAAFANYEHKLNATVAGIARTWYSLKTEIWLAEIDRQKVVLGEKLLQQAQSSYSLGLQTAYDLHNQQARIISHKNKYRQRQLSLRQTQRNLEQLLGLYPAATIAIDSTPVILKDRIPAGLPSELLQRRPDLLAAQAQLNASYETIAQARGDRFPSLKLTASAGRSSSELTKLNNDHLTVLGLAGTLAVPLFAFGTLKAQEELAQAQAKEEEAGYRQLLYQAFFEVEDALDKDQALLQQINLAEQASKAYSKSARTAAAEYSNGTGTFANWTNAEISAKDAITNVLTINRERVHNRINLYLALGGSFSRSISVLQEVNHEMDNTARKSNQDSL